MKPEIIYTSGPEGFCPVQAFGTVDGFPFYFRSRNQRMSLAIAKEKDADPINPESWAYMAEYGDNPYSAGYAPKEHCEAFIEEAAALWANR
jgi:hypothetical protein